MIRKLKNIHGYFFVEFGRLKVSMDIFQFSNMLYNLLFIVSLWIAVRSNQEKRLKTGTRLRKQLRPLKYFTFLLLYLLVCASSLNCLGCRMLRSLKFWTKSPTSITIGQDQWRLSFEPGKSGLCSRFVHEYVRYLKMAACVFLKHHLKIKLKKLSDVFLFFIHEFL